MFTASDGGPEDDVRKGASKLALSYRTRAAAPRRAGGISAAPWHR